MLDKLLVSHSMPFNFPLWPSEFCFADTIAENWISILLKNGKNSFLEEICFPFQNKNKLQAIIAVLHFGSLLVKQMESYSARCTGSGLGCQWLKKWFLWPLASNWDKVIDWRDANPCKEGNSLARRRESEGHGFESRCRQRMFSFEISIKVSLTDHLDVEFVHF